MSITGVCQVCESGEGTHTCERCGALVCETHYDRRRGLCTECARRAGDGSEQTDLGETL